MLVFGPDVTHIVAAEHTERLREAAAGGRPGWLRRRLGSILIATGSRLHPEADRLRTVGPPDSAGPRLTHLPGGGSLSEEPGSLAA
jgi:hypothetical protein